MSRHIIIELGDNRYPELSEARSKMPEPCNWDGSYYRTPKSCEFERIPIVDFNRSVLQSITLDEWEKTLVTEDGDNDFYIWKHIGTGLLFR
jgi:hypothetical protein